MKFCHQLEEQRRLSPVEWGPFFLNYELLKKKIKAMTSVEKDHKPPATTPEALSSSQSEVEFFRMMDYEIRRGAQFLAVSEGQYVLKTRTVLDGYRSTQHLLQSPMLGLDEMLTPEVASEMWIRLMRACISVYTELLFLKHWVVVSYCGFSKILKKHDRWTGFMTKEKYLRYVVAKQHFTSYPKLNAMLKDMEALYAHILGHLPECPERVEAEGRMDSVKKLVAAAGLDFSKHTGELTRSVEHEHESAHPGSTADAVGRTGTRPRSPTATEAAAPSSNGAHATGALAEATGLSGPAKRQKRSEDAFAMPASWFEQHRAEIYRHQAGTYLAGAPALTRDKAISNEPTARVVGDVSVNEGRSSGRPLNEGSAAFSQGAGRTGGVTVAVSVKLRGPLIDAGANHGCGAGPVAENRTAGTEQC